MAGEERILKRVLGYRLTYLSESASVRQSILDRMRNEELLPIVQTLDVGGVTINVWKDDIGPFVASLNRLVPATPDKPAAGDRYAAEPNLVDTEAERDYLWGEWQGSLGPGGEHHQKLRDAVARLLSYNDSVDVTGEYKGNKRDVLKKDSPRQLIFRAKENEDPGDEGKIHRAPED